MGRARDAVKAELKPTKVGKTAKLFLSYLFILMHLALFSKKTWVKYFLMWFPMQYSYEELH